MLYESSHLYILHFVIVGQINVERAKPNHGPSLEIERSKKNQSKISVAFPQKLRMMEVETVETLTIYR